jgi:hypothetical protein
MDFTKAANDRPSFNTYGLLITNANSMTITSATGFSIGSSIAKCALICSATLLSSQASHAQAIINGGFETGDFSGWMAQDLANPFEALAVRGNGDATSFSGFTPDYANLVIPTEGNFAVSHGFDGQGPGTITLSQDIGIIGKNRVLEFDYRAGWDLLNYGASIDRLFSVLIEPSGGGTALAAFPILTAQAGTQTTGSNQDTGPLSGLIDLSPYVGVNARITFAWDVPEFLKGPANAQLDNVRISSSAPVSVPAPLPVFGTAAAFAFSRRLRRRIRTAA